MPEVTGLRLAPLRSGDMPDIVDVFVDAFRDYPVMRYVLGPRNYDDRLPRLIELFVANRVWRDEAMFGVWGSAGLIGAATTTRIGSPDAPSRLVRLRDRIWAALGEGVRERYQKFSDVTQLTAVSEPHVHLNMIGVRRADQGKGISRVLLQEVSRFSDATAESAGVSLTTELPGNVRLYEHFGYQVVGENRVDNAFTTWTMFRPRPAG